MNYARIAASGAIGALLGTSLGLSVTEVIGSFLAVVVGIAVAVLGLSKQIVGERVKLDYLQIATFAGVTLIFILVGVFIRANDILSPSTGDKINAIKMWSSININPEYATYIVTGIPPPHQGGSSFDSNERVRTLSSVLSSGAGDDMCASLDPSQIDGIDNKIKTLRANDLKKMADIIDDEKGSAVGEKIYSSFWRLLCQ
mgnify:CR=1 FL=1